MVINPLPSLYLRSDSDGRGGYSWSVTFLGYAGDVPLLVADSDLTGYSSTISVKEVSIAAHGLGTEQSQRQPQLCFYLYKHGWHNRVSQEVYLGV